MLSCCKTNNTIKLQPLESILIHNSSKDEERADQSGEFGYQM